MSFASPVFLVYFLPATILGYYVFFFSQNMQNVWLLVASLLFLGIAWPGGLIYIIFLVLLNWAGALLIEKYHQKKKGSFAMLLLTCAFNIGYYKYFESMMGLVSSDSIKYGMVLPIGISFIMLQGISYCIDVYNGKMLAEQGITGVALYLLYFPKLAAGPIIDFENMREQMSSRQYSYEKFSAGVSRFVIGLCKKVFFANQLATISNFVFDLSAMGRVQADVPVMLAWLGLFAFTLQIYYQLSSCVDMAIGLSGMFGFDLPENFYYPYMASTLTDFWSRWNVTVVDWFRTYVYIPLNNIRAQNNDVLTANYLIVWLLIGLWHGFGWNYLFFGAMHFVCVFAEHFFGWDQPDESKSQLMSRIGIWLIIMIGWVLLATENVYQAGQFFMNLLGANYNGLYSDVAVVLMAENWLWLLLSIVFCLPVVGKLKAYLEINIRPVYMCLYPSVMLGMLLLCMAYIFQNM